MANVLLVNGNPTQGGTDGSLVNVGNPVLPSLLETGADAESNPIKLAIRTNPGYERAGPTALTPQGANALKWSLAPDDNGLPGVWGAWGAPLVLGNLLKPQNLIVWAKARVTADESYPMLYNDISVTLTLPDDAYLLVAVGKSFVTPYGILNGVGKALGQVYTIKNIVGRSLDQPYTMVGPVGKSLVMPYASGGPAGKSLAMPYGVIGAVGKSVGLPYNVITHIGKSAGLPYTIQPNATVKAAVLALSPLVYYELNETSGTLASQGSINLPLTAVGSPTFNQTGPKGTDKAMLFAGAQYLHATAVSNGLDFNGTASFTAACWFKPTSAALNSNLINYMLGSPAWYGWDYEYLGTNKIYRFRGRGAGFPGYVDNQFTWVPTAGTWYHLAFVFNGTDIKFYVNGTLTDTWTPSNADLASCGSINSNGRLHIGTDDTHTSPCNGAIAHPCVFGSALSQAQVATMYNGA